MLCDLSRNLDSTLEQYFLCVEILYNVVDEEMFPCSNDMESRRFTRILDNLSSDFADLARKNANFGGSGEAGGIDFARPWS